MNELPFPETVRDKQAAGEDSNLIRTLRRTSRETLLFSRFRLKRELGTGGMAVVWLADDERLGLEVALKFLPGMVATDHEALVDLRREIKRGLRLTHPGIVRLYDLHEDVQAGFAAIAMEYVDGKTLAEEKTSRPAGYFEAGEPLLSWVQRLCDILTYMHEQAQVVHRDLKPRNIMLTSTGELKVADFGISAVLTDSHSRQSQIHLSGTPAYMSPEQAKGTAPTVSDDIYALGATLYEFLTSKPPFFRGQASVVLHQLAHVVPPSLAERRQELNLTSGEAIPAAWEKTIAACLAKSSKDRPKSAREVAEQLRLTSRVSQAGAAREDVAARRKEQSVAAAGSPWRRYAVAGVAAALIVPPLFSVWPRGNHSGDSRTTSGSPMAAATPFAALRVEATPAVATAVIATPVAATPAVAPAVIAPPVAATPVITPPVAATPRPAPVVKSDDPADAPTAPISVEAQPPAVVNLLPSQRESLTHLEGGSVPDSPPEVDHSSAEADAAFAEGEKYTKGLGVRQDPARALAAYKRAVELGSAGALHRIGVMYATGFGVTKSDAKAVEFYQKSADLGFAEAQHDLGVRCIKGLGTPKDESAGIAWYRKAAAQGYQPAAETLQKRGLSLTGPDVPHTTPDVYFTIIKVPKGDKLNVHQGPGGTTPTVFTLLNTQRVQLNGDTVFNGDTEWFPITCELGAGWVSKKFLQR